jgi:hypothetical protein
VLDADRAVSSNTAQLGVVGLADYDDAARPVRTRS